MIMPGFSAEHCLKQHQYRYLQLSASRSVEARGIVQPQLSPLCRAASTFCFGWGIQSFCQIWLSPVCFPDGYGPEPPIHFPPIVR